MDIGYIGIMDIGQNTSYRSNIGQKENFLYQFQGATICGRYWWQILDQPYKGGGYNSI
jgi:hypothetical protein